MALESMNVPLIGLGHTLSTTIFHAPQARAMSQKSGTVPQTHGVRPRCIQTSGSEPSTPTRPLSRFAFDTARTVFRIPAELVEILTYFGDPHRNILLAKGDHESDLLVHQEHIERLTVVRKLTMTCWHLRNVLFPLLWEYVEGCNVTQQWLTIRNGLYAQCVYLILNPTIGAYVQCVYSLTHR